MEAKSDVELMKLVVERNERALEILMCRYKALVERIARRIFRTDTREIEETAQDAFMSVWKHAERFNASMGEFKAWLGSIAHNRAIDRLRSKILHGSNVTTEFDVFRQMTMAAPASDVEYPERFALERLIKTLKPDYQHMIQLRYYAGLTQEEIAQKLKIPVGTVKTRARDALMFLRRNQDKVDKLRRYSLVE